MTVDPGDLEFQPARWADASARLAEFDADALRRDLGGWVRDPAVRTVGDLRARLDERLGPHAGGLALASVCAAFGVSYARDDHRLPRAEHEHGARTAAVDRAVDAAQREVAWLRRLAAVIDGADGTPTSVGAAVDGLLDAVMEHTGLEEAWYQELAGPLAWLADRLGRPREALGELVDELYGVVFSSWVAPRPAPRRYGVRTIAGALSVPPAVPPELAARAAGVLRPSRERLAEALDAVAGREPAEALEALVARGLLDAAWLDGAARSLGTSALVTPRRRLRLTRGLVLALDVAPPGARAADLPLLAWLAADAAQVLRAEALAREAVGRLRPFGLDVAVRGVAWAPAPAAGERALWPIVGAAAEVFGWVLNAVDGVAEAPGSAGANRAVVLDRWLDEASAQIAAAATRPDLPRADRDLLARVWSADARWGDLAAAGETLPRFDARRRQVSARVAVRDVALPFEAIAALWDTGYGLRGVTDDGVLALSAPAPTAPGRRS